MQLLHYKPPKVSTTTVSSNYCFYQPVHEKEHYKMANTQLLGFQFDRCPPPT